MSKMEVNKLQKGLCQKNEKKDFGVFQVLYVKMIESKKTSSPTDDEKDKKLEEILRTH